VRRAFATPQGVKYSVKVKDLTDAEVASLRSQVAKFAVEGDLRAKCR